MAGAVHSCLAQDPRYLNCGHHYIFFPKSPPRLLGPGRLKVHEDVISIQTFFTRNLEHDSAKLIFYPNLGFDLASAKPLFGFFILFFAVCGNRAVKVSKFFINFLEK